MSNEEAQELADIIYRVNNPKYGDYSSHEETAQAVYDAGWRKSRIDARLYHLAQRDPIVKAIVVQMKLKNVSHDEGMIRMAEALSDFGRTMQENLAEALNNRTSHTIYVKPEDMP